MDKDRKIVESLRKLQAMDGLSEQEFYKKKQLLMRKMTAKATKFLYEKEPKKQGTSLREMAAKKEHEERMKKAGKDLSQDGQSQYSQSRSRSPTSRKSTTKSLISRKSSSRLRRHNRSPFSSTSISRMNVTGAHEETSDWRSNSNVRSSKVSTENPITSTLILKSRPFQSKL